MNFVFLLVDYEALVRENRADIVLFLLSTNKEYFILRLNRSEILRKYVSIPQRNLNCGLSVQLVDEQRLLLIAVIVEPGLDRSQDVVWLKTNHIVQEASELVSLRFDLDRWTSISLDVLDVAADFVFKVLHVVLQL